MRVENIESCPMKTAYKIGAFGTFIFCGLFLVAFILWSIAGLGWAILKVLGIDS